MKENKIEQIDKLMTELAKMYVKAEKLFIKIEREIPYEKKEKLIETTDRFLKGS